MKNTTNEIITKLKSPILMDIVKIKELSRTWYGEQYIHNEYSLDEALFDFSQISETLNAAAELSILDQEINFSIRSQIRDNLINLESYVSNTLSQNNNMHAVLDTIGILKNILTTNQIYNKIQGYPSFLKKKTELKEIYTRYINLVEKIEQSTFLTINSQSLFDEIKTIKTNAEEYLLNIKNIEDRITNLSPLLEERNQESWNLLTSIKTNNSEVNSIKEKLEVFNSTVDGKINNMNNFEEKTRNILSENTRLLQLTKKLLGEAVAESLFKAFDIRREELKITTKNWLNTIYGSIIALSVTSALIVWWIVSINAGNFAFTIGRILIATPFVYLVVFATRQYGRDKKLLEEYSFKSTLSLSLEAYRDIISKETDEKTKDTIISAIGHIFVSPRELYHKFPNKDDDHIDYDDIKKISELIKNFR